MSNQVCIEAFIKDNYDFYVSGNLDDEKRHMKIC